MLSGVGDERIHCRHCFYMAGRREWMDSAAGGVGAPWSRGFAPHPDVGLRLTPGKALFFRRGAQTGCSGKAPAAVVVCALESGVCASHLGKALFHRRGAQTFCRDKAPAAVWVCASYPGKPYSSVERRKPFAGKSRRWRCGFAPHSSESLILPLRGANQLPGKAVGGRGSLRPTPVKALFYRRGAQTNCREEAPAAR